MTAITENDGPCTVGLWDLLLLSIGGMMGSSMFFSPAFTGQLVGPAAVLAWPIAGVGMVSIALCYTELTTTFPKSGGPAIFLVKTLGRNGAVRRFASYMEGASYALGWVFDVTTSAWYVANYLGAIPELASIQGQTVPLGLLAIVASLGTTLAGIDVTKRTNLVFIAFLLTMLTVVGGVGLANGDASSAAPFVTGSGTEFFTVIGLAITGYGAWTAVPAATGEVKRPNETIPRAIVGSLLLMTAFYTAVVLALHLTVAPSAFRNRNLMMAAPFSAVLGDAGLPVSAQYLLPVTALIAIFTAMLVGLTSSARVLSALADRSLLPSALAATSGQTNSPYITLYTVTTGAGAIVIGRQVVDGIVLTVLIGTVLPHAINIASFVGLRVYCGDVAAPFHAPGGLSTAAIACCLLVLLAVGLSVEYPVAVLVTVVALLAGYLLQYLFGDAPATEPDA